METQFEEHEYDWKWLNSIGVYDLEDIAEREAEQRSLSDGDAARDRVRDKEWD